VRLRSGKTLVLEVKGQDSAQDEAKRAALRQWVQAVNEHGGFGIWAADVVLAEPGTARDAVERHG
jgi:type III restriction enzyme